MKYNSFCMKWWAILAIVIIVILFVYLATAIILLSRMDKSFYGKRIPAQENPCHPTMDDFPSLRREDYSVELYQNEFIRGFIYSDVSISSFKGFIILAHGLYRTHTRYLPDIDLLCKAGYQVLAFDHYGCGLSDGKGIISLCQGMYTLDGVIKDVEYRNINHGLKISLYGHSWGAFSIGGALAYHPEIEKAICRSAPTNVIAPTIRSIYLKNKALAIFFYPAIRIIYPILLGARNNIKSTFGLKKNKKTKTLFLHAKNDPMVEYSTSLSKYYLKHPQKNAFVYVSEKGFHDSLIDEESTKEYRRLSKAYHEIEKLAGKEKALAEKEFISSFDRADLMKVQDCVKEEILSFLED